jgi:chitin disaccharide deacetylase
MKRLIVNADDYGYTAGVSAGIRHAHREGIVTSTSVMMTMPRARVELETLEIETPMLGSGVHLTMTEGTPIRLASFPTRSALPVALAEISAADLRAEWRAQIEAFLASGLRFTHLDSHHHAAYRHEKALLVLLDLAHEYRVAVRNPYPIGDAIDAIGQRMIADSGVSAPDRFVDVLDVRTPAAEVLNAALGLLVDGMTEFMVHPAFVDDELRHLSPTFAQPRALELAALTATGAKEAVARHGIALTTFATLPAPSASHHNSACRRSESPENHAR